VINIINGSKTFITNGVYADYYVVAAKTSPELGNKGISIFLVDTSKRNFRYKT
jgi:acyl-CoA dehydrogenase